MSKAWAVSAAVIVVAVCITTYQVLVDPRVHAMQRCTAGFPNTERQVACAREIFGGQP